MALLLIRLMVCVYAVIQMFALVNHVSMGIDSGQWAETGLKNSPTIAAGIGMLLTLGALLTVLGLINRLGSVILFIGLSVLASYFPNPNWPLLLPTLLLTGILIVWGNGKLTADAMING